MQHTLLIADGWIVDIVFFVILIIGLSVGAKKGFVDGVGKVAAIIISIACAFFFCLSFEVFLEQTFGMTTGIANGLVNALSSSDERLAMDLSGTGLEEALSTVMPNFFAKIILGIYNGEPIPEGTTGAMLLGPLLAKWIAIAISFIILLVGVRLIIWLLTKLLNKIIDSVAPLRILNRLLGGILGMVKAILITFVVILVINWLPLTQIHELIESSYVVSKIINSNLFTIAADYFINMKWLNGYIESFLTPPAPVG